MGACEAQSFREKETPRHFRFCLLGEKLKITAALNKKKVDFRENV